jgi:glycosyltransferase involved in cell wall biosynthesis
MRILIVSHGHPELSIGGAEISSYELFQELCQGHGVSVSYLAAIDETTDWPAVPFGPFRDRTGEFVFPARGFDRFLLSQPSAAVQTAFSAFLRRLAPAVVHFHHYLNIGIELLALTRSCLPGVRIVVTLHEFLAICPHHGLMVRRDNGALCDSAGEASCARCFPEVPAAAITRRREALLAAFAKVDLFIAPSEFLRNRYIAWGLPAWQIDVLENAIAPLPRTAPRRLRAGERRARFGYFGQIHPFKGLSVVLSAFDHLPAEDADIHLVVHGAYLELNPAPLIAGIRTQIARHAGRITFAGPYRAEDRHRLMAAVDWVVVPSIWWENAPLVIEEALAAGRPVLCSGIGGMREKVRPGRDGIHVPPADPRAWAQAMSGAVRDPALWRRLRGTLRTPPGIGQIAAAHIARYREQSFSFGSETRGA